MRLFGHPIHPMLVHFPIALWTIATGAYVASAAGVTESVDVVARFANGGGLAMAMAAMLAGLLELRTIDRQSEAMRVAAWHMMMMAVAWVCFVGALMLSMSPEFDRSTAQTAAAGCAVAGFVLMGAGGWYGGRLVYEFGIAVKDRK
jgi:uncharacterized membrane protein